MNSLSPSLHRAVKRACWLAELAAALDDADILARELCNQRTDRAGLTEAILLREQLLILRNEINALQRRREPDSRGFHPNWT